MICERLTQGRRQQRVCHGERFILVPGIMPWTSLFERILLYTKATVTKREKYR